MKNSKKIIQLAIGVALGVIIVSVISKAVSKKETTNESLPNGDVAPSTEDSSTTPISGSSEDILEQLDEESANNLINELEESR